jgi:hypothetical protein
MLTRIRNAQMAEKAPGDADVQGQGGDRQGAEDEGYIEGFVVGKGRALLGSRSVLRRRPVIEKIEGSAGPAHHKNKDDIPRVMNGSGSRLSRRPRRDDRSQARATESAAKCCVLSPTENTTMSCIGNNPIKLPPKVEVTVGASEIGQGPLGTLSRRFGAAVSVEKNGDTLVFKAANEEQARCTRAARAGGRHGQRRY